MPQAAPVPADKADGRSSASPSDDPIAYATPELNKLPLMTFTEVG
jgi:hypothetical protein